MPLFHTNALTAVVSKYSYTGFPLNNQAGSNKYAGVPSWSDCQKLCQQGDGCKFFNYDNTQECSLMYGVGGKKEDEFIESHFGPKFCPGNKDRDIPIVNNILLSYTWLRGRKKKVPRSECLLYQLWPEPDVDRDGGHHHQAWRTRRSRWLCRGTPSCGGVSLQFACLHYRYTSYT